MQVKLVRPAPYGYKLPKSSLYASYNAVAQGLVEPNVSAALVPGKLRKFAAGAVVVTSDASRAKQTAAMLGDFKICPELRELGYTMDQLVSESDFNSLDPSAATTKARQLFFPCLFADNLSESHKAAVARAVALINHLLAHNQNVVAVSHGFFMKFFEVIVLHPAAAQNLELFQSYYDGAKPAYDFLDGPSFKRQQLAKALRRLKELSANIA